jgi:hypothetical protein
VSRLVIAGVALLPISGLGRLAVSGLARLAVLLLAVFRLAGPVLSAPVPAKSWLVPRAAVGHGSSCTGHGGCLAYRRPCSFPRRFAPNDCMGGDQMS